jgi:hypothetical protein
LQSRCCNE